MNSQCRNWPEKRPDLCSQVRSSCLLLSSGRRYRKDVHTPYRWLYLSRYMATYLPTSVNVYATLSVSFPLRDWRISAYLHGASTYGSRYARTIPYAWHTHGVQLQTFVRVRTLGFLVRSRPAEAIAFSAITKTLLLRIKLIIDHYAKNARAISKLKLPRETRL